MVIRELWERAKMLPAFEMQLFQNFILSSDLATEALLFSSDRPRGLDANRYDLEQFRVFYDSLLTFYAFIAGLGMREKEKGIHVALKAIVSDWSRAQQLLSKLRVHESVDSSTAGVVWSHIIDTAHIGEPNVVQFAMFAMQSLAAYGAAMSKA